MIQALEEKQLQSAIFQFVFPFSLNSNCQSKLKLQLNQDGYEFFHLKKEHLEAAYYGPGHRVSHRNLERYYLPFASNIMFPHEENDQSFQRYSKRLDLTCKLETVHTSSMFQVHSADVLLAPFDLGFITIRTELSGEDLTYTQALEFASRFRTLQNLKAVDDSTRIVWEEQTFEETEPFIFNAIVPGMLPFLDTADLKETYFEKLPFFVDESMYVQAFIAFAEETDIRPEDQYRAARMDGMDSEGKPYISSTNLEYIQRYCQKHIYDRWGPDTYYTIDETSFVCLTIHQSDVAVKLANHMYGEYYYGLLMNLFQKIVLLLLSKQYSHVQLDQNPKEIEDLIRSITTFSAKYYFLEVVSQPQGKEIFNKLRVQLEIDDLYEDVKQTLADLFKYQGNFTSKRSNYLLQILTIYTVISGIYGMNQVIEDFKAPIQWEKVAEYSVFEYIALTVGATGIGISFVLGVLALIHLIGDLKKKIRS
ncbi:MULTISPECIES: hypothetical protein [unclassified Paenibacillus]|uniref:hypothetical protein n=1 Tax=unclassified Paenibacillus TaxID=185978 RepID=UPI001AE61DF5|nr:MULTISPECIES: hypothetical protein [unclassified Paenibacillus]MBP1153841.1 hypothetical protein [Paenibacillus sp. PvP091]MBP1170774.1 hypothetical protein [Paenibacillus sp. PvR098]MBP2441802.1 hypothetical protein [Paenibacillus sp. PvP052]